MKLKEETFLLPPSTPDTRRGCVAGRGMMRIECWALNVFFLCLLAAATSCATRSTENELPPCCRPIAAQTNYTDKSIYLLDSIWTSDADKKVKLGVLRGRPQVVAMFFASCQYTCPLTVSDLRRIEAALPENVRANTGFTLISFDSKRDTPAALRAYRERQQLGRKNWTLLRGEPDDVREIAALLGVVYKQDADGNFAHSNLITVLNAEGEIVFQQPGLNLPPDEIVTKLKSLCLP
jgi:protein SCO1/2